MNESRSFALAHFQTLPPLRVQPHYFPSQSKLHSTDISMSWVAALLTLVSTVTAAEVAVCINAQTQWVSPVIFIMQ
jgi:hypothetical protein